MQKGSSRRGFLLSPTDSTNSTENLARNIFMVSRQRGMKALLNLEFSSFAPRHRLSKLISALGLASVATEGGLSPQRSLFIAKSAKEHLLRPCSPSGGNIQAIAMYARRSLRLCVRPNPSCGKTVLAEWFYYLSLIAQIARKISRGKFLLQPKFMRNSWLIDLQPLFITNFCKFATPLGLTHIYYIYV